MYIHISVSNPALHLIGIPTRMEELKEWFRNGEKSVGMERKGVTVGIKEKGVGMERWV